MGLTFHGESNAMIHPLLMPRLFCQTHGQKPLPRRGEHDTHPLRELLAHHAWRLYRRWGSAVGFVLGLAIALWLWLPSDFR